MKTAVSIPDDNFERAERLAREQVTDAMNRVCLELKGECDEKPDQFVSMAGRRVFERTDW